MTLQKKSGWRRKKSRKSGKEDGGGFGEGKVKSVLTGIKIVKKTTTETFLTVVELTEKLS